MVAVRQEMPIDRQRERIDHPQTRFFFARGAFFCKGSAIRLPNPPLGQRILVGEQTVITGQGQLSGTITGVADKRGAKLPG